MRKAELPEVRAERRSGRGAFGQSRCLRLNPQLGAMEVCQAEKESVNLAWNAGQRGRARWPGACTRPETGQVMRGGQNTGLGSDWLIRGQKEEEQVAGPVGELFSKQSLQLDSKSNRILYSLQSPFIAGLIRIPQLDKEARCLHCTEYETGSQRVVWLTLDNTASWQCHRGSEAEVLIEPEPTWGCWGVGEPELIWRVISLE